MTEDLGLWVLLLQPFQQFQQRKLLCFCPCVGRLPMFVQATLVADAERIILSAPFNFENARYCSFYPYLIFIVAFPPSGHRFTSFLNYFLLISHKIFTFLYKTVEEYRFLTIFALCFERDTRHSRLYIPIHHLGQEEPQIATKSVGA